MDVQRGFNSFHGMDGFSGPAPKGGESIFGL
jgi:hypothetical protein